jgi:Zn-dependent protease
MARSAKQEEVVVLRSPKSYEYSVSYGQPRLKKGHVYFSPKEVKHLAVAGLLILAIGFSSLLYANYYSAFAALGSVAVFAVILTLSFFAHEIAHKVTAQRRGLWAEFRLTMWGAVLSLVSVINPWFKILSPGAMMISGSSNVEELGRISLAGPVTNIVISTGCLGVAVLPSQFSEILYFAAFLNAFMAVFNLIPFGVFDGFKIFSWNKKTWGIVFVISLVLAIATFVLGGFSL